MKLRNTVLSVVLIVFAAVEMWSLRCPEAGDERRARNESGLQSVYSVDSADQFLRLMFPREVVPSGVAKVIVDPSLTRAWSSLEDTFDQHDEVQLPASVSVPAIVFSSPPLESCWLTAINDSLKAVALIESDIPGKLESVLQEMASSNAHPQSLIEKVFLQRDLFQVYSIFTRVLSEAKGREQTDKAQRVLTEISSIIRRLLLEESDLDEVRAIRREHNDTSGFRQDPTSNLADDYLPGCVTGKDDSWWPIDFRRKYNLHYAKYRGRSFIHIYARVPGMSHYQFREYWRMVSTQFGILSNIQGGLPRLPAESEMVLIRTMGALVDDGTMADTGIIEEVLIRRFATREAKFDPKSSDFRGTFHYQYILDRHRYLSRKSDFGLIRIHDDDPSFVGFFPHAPDREASRNEFMIPSRFNCINCHSETLHGAGTVFSLGYEEVANREYFYDGHAFAESTDVDDRVRLSTIEFRSLWEAIKTR